MRTLALTLTSLAGLLELGRRIPGLYSQGWQVADQEKAEHGPTDRCCQLPASPLSLSCLDLSRLEEVTEEGSQPGKR